MARINAYLKQHAELLNIATQISQKLTPQDIEKDAIPIADLLTTFAMKLVFHLSMEDRILYPTLLNSPEESARQTAKKFMDEMGGIAKVFEAYRVKWADAPAIQANPSEFINETKSLFEALGDRITREEKELYVLEEPSRAQK